MIQSRLTDTIEERGTTSVLKKTDAEKKDHSTDRVSENRQSTRYLDIDEEELKQQTLWPILIECVRRNPMYPNLRAYVSQEILPKEPNIRPRELAGRLSISIGEALVLLNDI